MITVLLLIRFDELHFYVRMNGIFTLIMFGEQKLGLGTIPIKIAISFIQ